MARLLLVIFVACIFVLVSANNQIEKLDTNITFIESVESLLRENPELELIPLEKSTVSQSSNRIFILYYFGKRVAGDTLLEKRYKSYTYPNLQDIRYEITYPQNRLDSELTYVEIQVDQSSDAEQGQAYIVSGGVNQNHISVVVEAKKTSYFIYTAYFFGFWKI